MTTDLNDYARGGRDALIAAADIIETEPSTDDEKGIARWLRHHATQIEHVNPAGTPVRSPEGETP